jgi:hypothetical protein
MLRGVMSCSLTEKQAVGLNRTSFGVRGKLLAARATTLFAETACILSYATRWDSCRPDQPRTRHEAIMGLLIATVVERNAMGSHELVLRGKH